MEQQLALNLSLWFSPMSKRSTLAEYTTIWLLMCLPPWRKGWSLTGSTVSSDWMCCPLWCWQKMPSMDPAQKSAALWCLWLCASARSWYVGGKTVNGIQTLLFPSYYFCLLAWHWHQSLAPSRKRSKTRSCSRCSLCWRSWIWSVSCVRGVVSFFFFWWATKFPVLDL